MKLTKSIYEKMVSNPISLVKNFFYREADEIITRKNNLPYLKRWYIVRLNNTYPILKYFGFNIYLHKFLSSDEDRYLHCHPWPSVSFILNTGYFEYVPKYHEKFVRNESRDLICLRRYPIIPVFRSAECIHKIELIKDEKEKEMPVWTLFITGNKWRDWGFWCPSGFKYHTLFQEKNDRTGDGC